MVKIGLVTVEIGQMSQGQMSQDKSCKRYAKAPKKQRMKKRYNNMEEDWGTLELIEETPTDVGWNQLWQGGRVHNMLPGC